MYSLTCNQTGINFQTNKSLLVAANNLVNLKRLYNAFEGLTFLYYGQKFVLYKTIN